MFFRLAGVRHTSYASARRLWPIPFDRWTVAVLLAAAVAVPWLVPERYMVGYVLPWIIWSTAALGLNLLMGWAGQIHLGYAAVMALGGYSAVHLGRAGVPFELAVLAGGLFAAIGGMLFAFAALRVKNLYLAISTLAMQYSVDWIISHVGWISGGTQATLQAPRVRILGFPVVSLGGRYAVALAICLVVTVFMLNLHRTSFGRALVAVREKDFAAQIIGVSPFRYKLLAFWCSSFIGGVSGAVLGFCYYQALAPELFHLEISIQVVSMVIVGGLGSIVGSFLGTALVLLAPIALNDSMTGLAHALNLRLSQEMITHMPLVMYGSLIVGFLLFDPLGLAKIHDNLRNYLTVWPFRHTRR